MQKKLHILYHFALWETVKDYFHVCVCVCVCVCTHAEVLRH